MELVCETKHTFLTKIKSFENIKEVLIPPATNKKIEHISNCNYQSGLLIVCSQDEIRVTHTLRNYSVTCNQAFFLIFFVNGKEEKKNTPYNYFASRLLPLATYLSTAMFSYATQCYLMSKQFLLEIHLISQKGQNDKTKCACILSRQGE